MAQQEENITSAVRTYSDRLFRFIRGKVPTNADAEDIAQEVWFQFSRVFDTEPIEQVSGWLFRVARNRITDRFRKRKEEHIEDFAYENEEGDTFFQDLLLSDPDTPETETIRSMFWEALFEALAELPENQRDVFVANELDGETLQSIADRTDTNIKTLISRKRYAVQFLRRHLEGFQNELLEL